jgi:hypothetical protein
MLTFLNSIPPYWEAFRAYLNEHVGDPDNPEDIERLKRQSPLFSADKITAPLLVIQGANDPRVKKPESDQIVVAMRDLGRDVEYMIAEDEGHGFLGEQNRMAMTVAMEKFLSKHLGGRFQEDINPETKKKLGELMVDVASVTIEEPAADPEKAMTAPLPKVDPSIVSPMKASYKANMSVMGQEIALDVKRSYEKIKVDGKPVWRTITNQESPMGAAADTFLLDMKTLIPIRRNVSQGPAKVQVDYTETTVKGKIDMGGREMPVDTKLPAPVFGEETAMLFAIESLPLAEGYMTTMRTYDLMSGKVRPLALEVTGIETVTVPAGSYEAYKIELKQLDGGSDNATIFISEKDPRCLVRGTFQLPAQAGGGTFTIELSGTE